MIIFLPGLDLATLKSYSTSAPLLLSLTNPSICTYLHNKSTLSYLSLFSKLKQEENSKHSLEDYILTPTELLENNFIPDESFKKAENKACPLELSIIGLDCEMVRCEDGLNLARVTIIDKNFEVIYDKYIKPNTVIIDYLTQYSGITEEIMLETSLTDEEAREQVRQLISENTIICGHSLENDLFHLKIKHNRIIDTSVIYSHPVPGFKFSLKTLSMKYLKKRIQFVNFYIGFS